MVYGDTLIRQIRTRGKSPRLRARAIAESVIGRPLNSGEVVHHIDHDPYNNAADNLLVCTRFWHARIHAGHMEPRAYRAPHSPLTRSDRRIMRCP